MKILLVYFSATGNTAFYARSLASAIAGRGHRCDLLDVEKRFDLRAVWHAAPVVPRYMIEAQARIPLETPIDSLVSSENEIKNEAVIEAFNKFDRYIANFDIIGFGSPVYFFEPAAVFSSFIKLIPVQTGKKAFTFATHMEGPVWFRKNIREALEARGFRIIGHADDHIIHTELLPVMPKFIAGEGVQKAYLRYRRPRINKKIKAFLDSVNLVKGSTPDQIQPAEAGPVPQMDQLVGGLVEKALYATLKFSMGSRIIKEKCVKCGLCASSCPMKLIRMDADTGYPVRTSHCMYCLRCINICPAEAVSYAPLSDGRARFRGFEKLEAAGRVPAR